MDIVKLLELTLVKLSSKRLTLERKLQLTRLYKELVAEYHIQWS